MALKFLLRDRELALVAVKNPRPFYEIVAMAYRDAKSLTQRQQVQRKFVPPSAKQLNVFRCLIVSPDQSRREMLERAADDGGWSATLCRDARTALVHASRSLVQLAVVDLQTADSKADEGLRLVVQRLAAERQALLIVCGNEANAVEEAWARQLGAWLYLPGVMESNNLALLCGEARQIAERLGKANRSEPAGAPRR